MLMLLTTMDNLQYITYKTYEENVLLGSQSHPKKCLTSHSCYTVFFLKATGKLNNFQIFKLLIDAYLLCMLCTCMFSPIERVWQVAFGLQYLKDSPLTMSPSCLTHLVASFQFRQFPIPIHRGYSKGCLYPCDGICTQAMATEAGKTKKMQQTFTAS